MAKPLGDTIEHVVVLMMENRSFDNVLGGLYPGKTKNGTYRGLLGTETNPLNPTTSGGKSVTVFQGPATLGTWIMPYPDPGEDYSDMVQQIFGSDSSTGLATMSGFAWNYAAQPCSISGPTDISGPGWPAGAAVPGNIMQYYSKDTMPATFALAEAFAGCDCWFAAAPVETISNRVFTHCGTPSKVPDKKTNRSRVNNGDYFKDFDPRHGKAPVQDKTIFELLDETYGPMPGGSANWRVYYHDVPLSVLCQYVWNHLNTTRITPYPIDFAADVAYNKLPKYSFIEPGYFSVAPWSGIANCNHPGGSMLPLHDSATGEDLPPAINVLDGERLLCDVYSTLLATPEVFKKTLLIVTYDEHGGLFDHVGPPAAVSPFSPCVDNFNYDRFGVRVPTILINPYIAPGSVYPARAAHAPLPNFDHTSILRTLIEQFDLGDMLSPRVQGAPPISGLISQTYTQPPKCPPIPATPAPPVMPALPPCPTAAPPRRPHSLADGVIPLYRYIEGRGGPRALQVA